MENFSTTRAQYLAGLFDGDGHISIQAHEHKSNYINYDVVVGVTSVHLPTIHWLENHFGGKHSTSVDKRPNRKLRHFWYAEDVNNQLNVLSSIHPFLQVKAKQAEEVTRFLQWGGKNFQNPKARQEVFDSVSQLNGTFIPVSKVTNFATLHRKPFYFEPYLAGLIDAEGCISLYENKRSFDPKIQIANTDMRMFDIVLNATGGSVSLSKRENRALGNWNMPAEFLGRYLTSILPYLVTKKQQGELLLQYLDRRKVLSDEEVRESYIKEFRRLNFRGLSPTANTPDTLTGEDRV